MGQEQFLQKKLEVVCKPTGSMFFIHLIHLGEYIEGLKHFAVSDVKFHPQRYIITPGKMLSIF